MTAHHTIWIVTGTCGAYSDKSIWTVCWRHTEADAKAVVEVLNEEAAAYKAWEDGDADGDHYGPRGKARRATMADPYFQADYTGTHYTCQPIADDARALFDELQARQGKP